MSKIRVRKSKSKDIVKILPGGTFIHNPAVYLSDIKYSKYSGENVSISIIGTGVPFHRDFVNIEEYANFSQEKTTEDTHGLSVQIGGIVGANNPEEGILGMAFSSKLYFAKALDNRGTGDINSLNASILWSLVKGVDLIIIPFGLPEINEALLTTLKKVRDQKVAILYCGTKGDPDIDGIYNLSKRKRYNIWTTATDVANYTKPAIKVSNIGIAAGTVAMIIDKFKKSKKDFSLEKVYKEFERIL